MNRFRRRVISAMFVVLGGSPAAADGWSVEVYTDPMTDERTTSVRSALTSPVTPMRRPYADNWGWLALRCDATPVNPDMPAPARVSLGFKYKPFLRERYGVVTLPVRFGDAPPFDVSFVHSWGSRFFFVKHRVKAPRLLARVLQESEMLIGIPWHDHGTVYFRFDLRGSRKAFREACGR